MNIIYHAAIGLVGESIVRSDGWFFAISVLPDAPLIANEVRLRVQNKKFNANDVPDLDIFLYHCTHSIFVSLFFLGVNPIFGVAHLIHIVSDWFTHTGRFASRPFHPVCSYQVKFGREILK